MRKILIAAAALLLVAGTAHAADESGAQRAERYAAYQREHPNLAAEIADLRAKTAALVARAPRQLSSLNAPSTVWRVPGALHDVWDGADVPEMVVIPAGEFTMGSPASEAERYRYEGPRHRVRIGYAFAMGKYEITIAQYRRFVAATHYNAKATCSTVNARGEIEFGKYDWENPRLPVTDRHPAVCLDFDDAKAYVRWLAATTGKPYRLLSEAEWEYATRAGTTTARYWGETSAQQCIYANGVDRSSVRVFPKWEKTDCDDGAPYIAAVGTYKPNPFGVYETIGNVWEWMEDCWNETYVGAPTDGSAWTGGDCDWGVLRSGSWDDDQPRYLRAAERLGSWADERVNNSGFRLARDL